MKRLFWKLLHPGQRYGDWQLTYTGRQLWASDPRPGDFMIEEIAHNLSLICRFAGSVAVAYPVSSHLVMVSDIVRNLGGTLEEQLQALLHDATESVISDIPAPLKRFLPQVKAAEQRIWRAMAKQFKIPAKMSPLVKQADRIALITERRDLFQPSEHRWAGYDAVQPIAARVRIMSAKAAEKSFLERYHHLRAKIAAKAAQDTDWLRYKGENVDGMKF